MTPYDQTEGFLFSNHSKRTTYRIAYENMQKKKKDLFKTVTFAKQKLLPFLTPPFNLSASYYCRNQNSISTILGWEGARRREIKMTFRSFTCPLFLNHKHTRQLVSYLNNIKFFSSISPERMQSHMQAVLRKTTL